MTLEEVARLEISARRGLSTAWHPDRCKKIDLRGVGFAVRPLYPSKDVGFVPTFSGDTVDVQVDFGEAEPDGSLIELAEKLTSSMPIQDGEVCPECGQPKEYSLLVDLDKHRAFLALLAQYAGRILRQQYELTDEQLSDLLRFEGDIPIWVQQVLRHAMNNG